MLGWGGWVGGAAREGGRGSWKEGPWNQRVTWRHVSFSRFVPPQEGSVSASDDERRDSQPDPEKKRWRPEDRARANPWSRGGVRCESRMRGWGTGPGQAVQSSPVQSKSSCVCAKLAVSVKSDLLRLISHLETGCGWSCRVAAAALRVLRLGLGSASSCWARPKINLIAPSAEKPRRLLRRLRLSYSGQVVLSAKWESFAAF